MLTAWPLTKARAADPSGSDHLNLFLQKGFITESEAAKAKAEMEEIMRTNAMRNAACVRSMEKLMRNQAITGLPALPGCAMKRSARGRSGRRQH